MHLFFHLPARRIERIEGDINHRLAIDVRIVSIVAVVIDVAKKVALEIP